MPPAPLPEAIGFGKLPRTLQWFLLLLGSGLLATLIAKLGVPAALLLGPMLVGIVLSTNGATLAFPKLPYFAGQAFLGCFIASKITLQSVLGFFAHWPLFLSTVVLTIASATLLGYMMSRFRLLPGTTAIWGLSPGAAGVMIVMAEAFGENPSLVAFMQYLRGVTVAIAAAVIAAIWFGTASHSVPAVVWFPSIRVEAFVETLALAGVGGVIAHRLRIPGGVMLVPFAGGAVLQATGLLAIELPPWFMAVAFVMLGWHVGLGFTRELCWYAIRALPWALLAIAAMMAICGFLAWMLVLWLGVDPLTAFLATAPGGLDTMVVIATSTRADIAFVMALQTARFLIVLPLAPALARLASRHLKARAAPGDV
ncbi:AbrB family transcriptional regulator [Comamonadaceae bacterium G21597-S1]|nr:AbrB family transcriptional regulator [Comamonadaceae bacterium G21597-S1]